MQTEATRRDSVLTPALYMAIECGERKWKLGFTIGLGQQPRVRVVPARDLERLREEIERAKARFRLPTHARTRSCYEAGRDGFWLHRALEAMGVENLVVDSASIEVSRRRRRAKTDKLDAQKLVRMLVRYHDGERRVWSVVRVPTVEQEDQRQLQRTLRTAKEDRTSVTNRIKSLLATQGITLASARGVADGWQALRTWDGRPLPEGLRMRLERDWQTLQQLNAQIAELVARRKHQLENVSDPAIAAVHQLMRLRGIGIESAWLYVMEFFGWREFKNVKQIGALAGLVPTPHQSGNLARELGITKAGNRHVRALAIEIAWGWVNWQPESALTRWFNERFAEGGSRRRRIGIVALARKLLIELWKYLQTGTPPEGAVLTKG